MLNGQLLIQAALHFIETVNPIFDLNGSFVELVDVNHFEMGLLAFAAERRLSYFYFTLQYYKPYK